MKPVIDASVLNLTDMILINRSILDAFEDILHVGIPLRVAVGALGVTLKGIELSLPPVHDCLLEADLQFDQQN